MRELLERLDAYGQKGVTRSPISKHALARLRQAFSPKVAKKLLEIAKRSKSVGDFEKMAMREFKGGVPTMKSGMYHGETLPATRMDFNDLWGDMVD